MSDSPLKPLFWVANSRDDLREFPDDVKALMGFALFEAQQGSKHISAKPLKGFGGAGVLEIVEDDNGSTYRGIYTVKFSGAVYVLDAFQKKSKKGNKTPQGDLERIKKRFVAAKEHYNNWRLTQRNEGAK